MHSGSVGSKRVFQVAAVALCAAGIGLTLWFALARTGGHLVYALDDPYIHLAVAEGILEGVYGVNAHEYASPSSSILYPFLLAGFLALGFGDYGPLLINVIGSCVAAWLVAGVFWSKAVEPSSKHQIIGAALCLPMVLLALNLVGLPMTGMEHTLHLMASVGAILAISEIDKGRSPSFFLLLCIVLAPLLRFEGIALAGAALAALVIAHKYRAALGVSLVLIAIFGAYFTFMSQHGLPLLPSSVLTKSNVGIAAVDQNIAGLMQSVVLGVFASLDGRAGALLGIAVAALLLSVLSDTKSADKPWLTIFVASTAVAAHIAAGKYDWFSRYEIYALAIAFVGLLIAWSSLLSKPTQWPAVKFLGIFAILAVVATPYISTLHKTPAASENVFAQQYQMHRFSTEFFPHNMAVNDLGYVSYQNDLHVLDLWGLGSEAARKAHATGTMNAARMADLTAEAGSVFAMIYSYMFRGEVPADWCHVAVLHTPSVSVPSPEVDFYLIAPSFAEEMDKALTEFAKTLPAVSRLERKGC